MKKLTTLLLALATTVISATTTADSSRAHDIIQHVLNERGWKLDWRIDEDFLSPAIPVRQEFYLGAFLRDMMHPFVALNRDVAIVVCESYKSVVVYRDMGAEDTSTCKQLFNRADFEQ